MTDLLDVLSLAEGKTAIGIGSGTGQDTKLAQFITALSRRMDVLLGAVVIRTVTNEKHDGGKRFVRLKRAPMSLTSATTITTVTEYNGTASTVLSEEDEDTKPATAFLFEPETGFLYRRAGNSDVRFAAGRRNILVTYEAGRYATTALVDAKFKNVAASILRRLWQREAAAWARGEDPFAEGGVSIGFFKAVDPMITELLSDELTLEHAGLAVG